MKAVLISSIPLPYYKIGSWTIRYTELITSKQNPFEYVICPKNNGKINDSNLKYLFAKRYKKELFFKLFYKYSYYFFLKQLKRLLKKEEQLVIYIIDNVKLLHDVHDYLVNKKVRNKCKIIFNSCGYSYFFNAAEGIKFYDKIDHIIYSTYQAYQFELNRFSYIASKVSIIPNGIDSSKFYKISKEKITVVKKQLGYENKEIVLWVSQERPKKGLLIFLEAWKKSKLYSNQNYVLLIIGTSQNQKENNIHFLGKTDNNNLPKYYQSADYYFFTTLVHEGFGLSLGEALKCGATSFS